MLLNEGQTALCDGTAQVVKRIVARERAARVAVQYAAENRK
jgi:hypothetical protein